MNMALKKSLYKRHALMGLLCFALASHIDLKAAYHPSASSSTMASEEEHNKKSVEDKVNEELNSVETKPKATKDFNLSWKAEDSKFEEKFDIQLKKNTVNLLELYTEAEQHTEAGATAGEKSARQQKQADLKDTLIQLCTKAYNEKQEDDSDLPEISDEEFNISKHFKNLDCVEKPTLILNYKKQGCSSCDWTAVDKSLMDSSYSKIAEALIAGLSEQGQKEFEKYEVEQKKIARQKACKEDSNGKSLLAPKRSSRRIICLWDKKVLSKNKMSDKIEAYNEHVHHRLEAMVHSIDPNMRSQSQGLIRRFYSRAKGFSNDSLAAKLDAMMLQQQTMSGLLNLASRCGVPQTGHAVGVHGQHNTACLMTGVRRIQVDLRQKSHNMAHYYRSVNRQQAQALSSYMHQRFGDEFTELLENPVQFMHLRRTGLYDNFGNLPATYAPMTSARSIGPRSAVPTQNGAWPTTMPTINQGYNRQGYNQPAIRRQPVLHSQQMMPTRHRWRHQ